MSSFIDLTGQRFGRLTVIKLYDHASRKLKKPIRWLCRCDCGNECVVRSHNLKSGNTQSCGCIHEDSLYGAYKPNVKRLYNSWRAMKARCNNPNNNRYYAYGARGITVCKEWDLFKNFEAWAMVNGYKNNLTIDRIDVNGNYEPSNCRWISPQEQSKNRRRVKHDKKDFV